MKSSYIFVRDEWLDDEAAQLPARFPHLIFIDIIMLCNN